MISVEHADEATFAAHVLERRGSLVLVYFFGPGCPNCERFAEALPALLAELEREARSAMHLVKVDAYACPALATRYAVFGIPAFFAFRDGKRLGRISEFRSAESWLAVIRGLL
ncbi:MAG: thioredoxin family protein [Myxococcales bacterium]|nr:thioredoxin family protein [Myxococcales bacterium]